MPLQPQRKREKNPQLPSKRVAGMRIKPQKLEPYSMEALPPINFMICSFSLKKIADFFNPLQKTAQPPQPQECSV